MDCFLLDGNETTFWFDSWTVIFENKTIGRETMANWFQGRLTVFGSILSIWIVVSNLFLLCTALLRPLLDPDRETSRSMRISLSLIQVLIGGVAIPVNLVTYARGRWIFGRVLCNISLLGQMFLVANTAWTLVALTFDLVFRTIWPSLTRTCWWTGLGLLGAWIMAALSVLPMVLRLELGDAAHLLQDMCAVVMTKEAGVLLSLAVFLLPAAISTIGCIVLIVVARWRVDRQPQPDVGYTPTTGSVSVLVASAKLEAGCCSSTATTGSPHVDLVAANACCVVTWSPFFVVNALVSFCADMCIDPGAWSLLLWVGYLAPALLPVAWFIDRGVRQRVWATLRRGGNDAKPGKEVTCCNVRGSSDVKSEKEPENEVLL